ncbi:MAG: biopolymer transporter ExbD [Lentisphaeria bacterium]|jgi:biopolymer transport protein ExbD|nr:biopolymer transporter ExbD [Lentisphaeria bacterium]MBQ9776072.1 biopolymer transporter ExbD [Lentisphaeria bacterium]
MIVQTSLGSRRFQTRLKPVSGWPPLVALIDLMFLLLLFFVLATSFVSVSGIQVNLPQVRGGNVVDMERYVVTVVPSDRKNLSKPALIYFNDRQVTPEQLKQELNTVRNHSRSASVIIMADKDVPQGVFAEIMGIAENAQLSVFLPMAAPEEKNTSVFLQ